MFTNREEAGKLLANKLMDYSDNKEVVIVAIPRGGVPVGVEIAKNLNAPLEIVLSKKIGHPFNKEYAIGAVTLKNSVLSDAALEVSQVYIHDETERIRKLLKQRLQLYYEDRKPVELKDKIVILVDDGIATGNTMISCIQLIGLQKPSKIMVALPVAPASALKKILELPEVSETICLSTPFNFQAVGQFYEDFNQVDDKEVIALLKKANKKFGYGKHNILNVLLTIFG
ncbi:MAG: phosphoribosyltransferase [Bacteroidetes bacterium HGW-Bacteroidetes-3]|jgi:predicted phosphoribosyltransferase|nr:MAG: phosphoribosyltransferase [Bacteroidetes bacterium HGW-Bacteroidetes-3]